MPSLSIAFNAYIPLRIKGDDVTLFSVIKTFELLSLCNLYSFGKNRTIAPYKSSIYSPNLCFCF